MEVKGIDELGPWLDHLVALYLDAYQGLGEYAYTRPRDVRHYMRWLFKRAPHSFFLAVEGQRLLGFIVADSQWLEEGEPVGEIHEIVVAPGAREKGVGKALIEKALEHFQQEGLGKVGLWVGERNLKAQEFYRRLGFRERGKVGHWIRMERPLP
ncbi:MAG: N-acetyltransferase [Aquificota bacterium]|nr:MAG: N-acetyltransferase [Aquificota bacterium]